MRPLIWLARVIVLTVLCSCLLAAAAAIGRGMPTAALAVARLRGEANYRLDMLIIDLNRGTAFIRYIPVPDAISVDWITTPPQVVQRAPARDTVVFTLSSVDFAHARLTPLVEHQILDTSARWIDFAVARSRAAVYEPTTGEVTLLNGGQLAQATVTVESGITQPLVWSPDGQRLAVKNFRGAALTLLDAEGARSIEVFRDSAPVWSPDSRLILFTQDSFVERNGRLRVYDAVTGEVLPAVDDVLGRSGAWCDSDTLAFVRVISDGRHTVQRLDLLTGTTTEIIGTTGTDGQEILDVRFAPHPDCDWLLLTMRHPNELNTRLYRLSAATGQLTRLGENAHILALTAESVTYDSNAANVALSVGRADFIEGAVPEVYGRAPAQIEEITWFNDFRQGLFLRSGELWRLDLATGTSSPLPVTRPIQAFQVVNGLASGGADVMTATRPRF